MNKIFKKPAKSKSIVNFRFTENIDVIRIMIASLMGILLSIDRSQKCFGHGFWSKTPARNESWSSLSRRNASATQALSLFQSLNNFKFI